MSRELEIEREMFYKALHNAIFWQNRYVELCEIIEMFCLDAEANRTWVGLTDDEVRKICVSECGGYEQARTIEATLRSKNT